MCQCASGQTAVPARFRVVTMPFAASALIASRTTVRLTPSVSPSSGSVGSTPEPNRPAMIHAAIRSTAASCMVGSIGTPKHHMKCTSLHSSRQLVLRSRPLTGSFVWFCAKYKPGRGDIRYNATQRYAPHWIRCPKIGIPVR